MTVLYLDTYMSVSLHHLSTCIVAKSEEIAKSDITISKVAEMLNMSHSYISSTRCWQTIKDSSLIKFTYMHDSSTCNVPRNQIDKLDM